MSRPSLSISTEDTDAGDGQLAAGYGPGSASGTGNGNGGGGRDGYMLSSSGTFRKGDFSINSTGILGSPQLRAPSFSTPALDANSPNSPLTAAGGVAASPGAKIRLDDLELGQVLGQGAGGLVQCALHRPTGALLALKQLSLGENEQKHVEIIKELRALHVAQHANIVRFFEAFYIEGKVVLCLELMDQGSLANILARLGPIPEPVIATFTAQTLQGLVYLHKTRHIVHRDIKPGNILVNSEGIVKIADFGITRELDSSYALTETFVGTSMYMSPERIVAGAHSYSSDIWALGITLYEVAVGRYPYSAGGYFDLLDSIVKQPPVQLPATVFSLEFCDFVHQCLQKDAALRPSALELLSHPFITSRQAPIELVQAWLRQPLPNPASAQQ